ncbi:CU044_2847 family protein [Nocardioides sp. Soil796]|uniref:CU044_2847 family protein n=1 Tax=Nocardioides sp. Soil796 TaxID=1736412 RepID=UPI00070DAFDF|nr:CU044_2847 family protein [Nocardioides sp. Soil796]KRF14625.1 hypothetical protein ASH02_09960 [Nocardioides sp. Soil796]
MSTDLVVFETDGRTVIVELSEPLAQGGYETVGVGGASLAKAGESLEAAMSTIRDVADSVMTSVAEAVRPPDEVEVTFGLKFGVSAGVFVSKGSAEANLLVKLNWDRPSSSSA